MIQLGFIEKLLDGAGVEWKTLGEVSRFINGRAYKKTELLDQGKYPVLRVGNFFTNQNWYYSDLELNEDKYCANGDLLYAWSASFGPRIWEGGKVIYHYHIWKVIPDEKLILKKFLFYLLEWDTKLLKSELATGSTMMHVSKGAIENRKVPIPSPNNREKSLSIQAEIVLILDSFTELTAELTKQLTTEFNARKKQYNYYREQLFSFNKNEVEWKMLGEVVNIKNGKDWKKLGAGDIPVYGSGGIMQYVDTFAYDEPTVLIPRKGSITNIFYVETPFWNVDTIYYTEIDIEQVIPKFFYYYMTTIDLMLLDTGSGRPSLTQAILNNIKVPLPTLNKQATTVAILDKFDTLTNSISEGLPREIELRQKQYEYYRDLLLSFPKY